MPLTLQQLLLLPSAESVRARLLTHLQGVGFTQVEGFSPGTISVLGSPTQGAMLKIRIATAGSLGSAEYELSLDDGATYDVATSVPSDGQVALAGYGVTLSFANGPGTEDSFVAEDVFSIALAVSRLPVTSWQPGSVSLTLVENDAAALTDVYATQYQFGKSGFLEYAEGDWLDLNAESNYSLERRPGVSAIGNVTLEDAGGSGPYTFGPAEVYVVSDSGRKFFNVEGFTLTLDGTIDVPFGAERPGSGYNVGGSTINTLVTSLPGVTVSNAPGWLIQQGVDKETDEALTARCRARWPSLGQAGPVDVYDLWAKTASPEVTRTRVIQDPTEAGRVLVYLAGPSGAVSGAAVTAVNAYSQPRIPLTSSLIVAAATELSYVVEGTVYVRAGYLAQATAEVAANLEAYINGGRNSIREVLPGVAIGGTVYATEIIEQIQVVKGVRNVVLVSGDETLTGLQVATLVNDLVYVEI